MLVVTCYGFNLIPFLSNLNFYEFLKSALFASTSVLLVDFSGGHALSKPIFFVTTQE